MYPPRKTARIVTMQLNARPQSQITFILSNLGSATAFSDLIWFLKMVFGGSMNSWEPTTDRIPDHSRQDEIDEIKGPRERSLSVLCPYQEPVAAALHPTGRWRSTMDCRALNQRSSKCCLSDYRSRRISGLHASIHSLRIA